MSGLPAVAAGLRAVTREIEPVDDLLDALGPDGFCWLDGGAGIVTAGVAAIVPARHAAQTLREIATDDPLRLPGTGPVAVGALPFDPSAPATVEIPARVLGRHHDGRTWVTHIGAVLEHAPAHRERPTRFTVRARQSRDWWDAAIRQVLTEIAAGSLAKVVLAREVVVEADAPFDRRAVLARLRAQQPGCICYAHGGLVGATPELLVRRVGREVESRPMAGTAPGSVATDVAATLRASGKDAREHRFVVDAVRETLGPLAVWFDAPAEPRVEHFGGLAHLVTPIRATLRAPDADALTLARRLHPSPAVGGTPAAAALAAIRRLEPFDRGTYAGPVGWMDARGDGAFAVALRGAQIAGTTALLRAGAGIVAGSDPEGEWAETAAKLEPMLRALVTP